MLRSVVRAREIDGELPVTIASESAHREAVGDEAVFRAGGQIPEALSQGRGRFGRGHRPLAASDLGGWPGVNAQLERMAGRDERQGGLLATATEILEVTVGRHVDGEWSRIAH